MAFEFEKGSGDTLDYSLNWAAQLTSGDTIDTSSYVAESGITEVSESNDTTTSTVWLSGGTIGTTYSVVNTIVTTLGRTIRRELLITVVEFIET